MTLLKAKDIEDVAPGLERYDERLRASTGSSLLEIACLAAGFDVLAAMPAIAETSVMCVPLTCGEGKIGGFAETLASIARH